MKPKTKQLLQYFILLVAGVVLCYLFFRNFQFSELQQNISTGNFSWFYLVMLVSAMVYIIRTLRWQMLIKAMGYETKFMNALAALSISYFVSFVIPRLGEVTRCLSVKKKHDIPFMELLGTVIIERVVDIFSLMIILLLTVILQFNHIIDYVKSNVLQPVYHSVILKIMNGNTAVLFALIAVIGISTAVFFYFRKQLRQRTPKIIIKFIEGLKHAVTSIGQLKQKKLFFLYTFSIWVCYYLMTYFWFFVFKETSVLTWGACLSILSIGTIGRSIPVQGAGMGTYHFFVTGVAMLYGLTEQWGKTLATVIHLGQTFFTFAMGLLGLIIFFVMYWKKREKPLPDHSLQAKDIIKNNRTFE